MHCKYCNTAIPSTTRICPNCGKMATKDQMTMLNDFNKNSGWDKYTNNKTHIYKKEGSHDVSNLFGIILIVTVILILIIVALLRILTG